MTTSKFIDLYKADNQFLSPDPKFIAEVAVKMEKESVKIKNENRIQNCLSIFKTRSVASKFAATAAAIFLIINGVIFLPVIYNNRNITGNEKNDEIGTLQQTSGAIDEDSVKNNNIGDDNETDYDINNGSGITSDKNTENSSINGFTILDSDNNANENISAEEIIEPFADDFTSGSEQSTNNADSAFSRNDTVSENNVITGENSEEHISEDDLPGPRTFSIESFNAISTESGSSGEVFSDEMISAETIPEETIFIEDLPEDSLEGFSANEFPFDTSSLNESSSDDSGFIPPNQSLEKYEEVYGDNNNGINSGLVQNIYNSVSGYLNWPEVDYWDNIDISEKLPEHYFNKDSSDESSDVINDFCNDVFVESDTSEAEPKPLIPLNYTYFKDFAESFLSGTHAVVGVEYNISGEINKKDLLGKDTTPFYALLSSCLDKELSIISTNSKDYVLYTIRANGREVNFRITTENKMEITLSDYSGGYFIELQNDIYNKIWNLAKNY